MAVWLFCHGLAPDEPDGRSFPDAVASGCIQKYRNRGYTIVNDPSVLPMGGEGQCLGPQAKRSTFDDETLFIPFDDVAPNLPTFDAREIRWTLGEDEQEINQTMNLE